MCPGASVRAALITSPKKLVTIYMSWSLFTPSQNTSVTNTCKRNLRSLSGVMKILRCWFALYLMNTSLHDLCLTSFEGLRAHCALDLKKGSGPEEVEFVVCSLNLGFVFVFVFFLLGPDLFLFFLPPDLAVLNGSQLIWGLRWLYINSEILDVVGECSARVQVAQPSLGEGRCQGRHPGARF